MSPNVSPNTVREMWRRRFEGARLPAAPQMPTKRTAAFAAIALLSALPFSAQAQKPVAANVTADLPAGPMQSKAATSCLECHEARIILQQRLSKGAWTKEVDKMVKWGAVVDPADHDALIDYLSANFSPDKPPYEPQRTADKDSSRKTK
jgi:mono/diheme cytochrome c family protein